MKKISFTTLKITLGIFSILIPFILLAYLTYGVVFVQEIRTLKWFPLLISALGFYISGMINRKTPLKFIPFLYISLLLFIPLSAFYFPLILFVILFATISLVLTRNEVNRNVKSISLVSMSLIFMFFLFSQPLTIRHTKDIHYLNGKLQNITTLWDFSKKEDVLNIILNEAFINRNNEKVNLSEFKVQR